MESFHGEKKYHCPMCRGVRSDKPGKCPHCDTDLVLEKEKKQKFSVGANPVSYICPMHPEIQRDNPGLCPDCGMRLLELKKKPAQHKHKEGKAADYDKHIPLEVVRPKGLLGARALAKPLTGHAGHSTAIFFQKFWISLALTVPVVLYSDIIEHIFGFRAPEFPGSAYLPLVLGSIVFFYAGWVFLAGAWRELRARLPGMMTLIGIAVSAAYLWSVYAFFAGAETLFWELTTLITVMLLGHWFEVKAVSGAQGALKELSKLLPDTVEKIVASDKGRETRIVPLNELREGDIVFVRPGGRMPADGVVIEGQSETNESMITGESAPAPKKAGSEVIAGTVNGDSSLTVKVTKVGEHTFLAGVRRLVEEAQNSKSRLQILSDRAAFYLTLIALATGGLTFGLWLISNAGFSFAMERLVAVLVVACPHALGLAVPLVASISTTLAARYGFLVKQRLALEAARSIQIVLFDKTGTLTKGEYGVTNVWSMQDENDLIRLAASVDAHSEHFISKAIVDYAKEKGVAILEVKNFSRIPGKGVRGIVGEAEVLVGGKIIIEEAGLNIPNNFAELIEKENKKGKTIIYCLKNGDFIGAFALADTIREESRKAVADLKKLGIRVAMVTGDSENVAEWVAKELGLDEYFARLRPQEKAEKVKSLQAKGYRVAMIGDGINDAPALAQADLGIAIGAGTNVAIESAGIILVKNDPRDIVKIIKLSRATYSKMLQNLFWATGYNVVALPLAAGVFASKGILLEPALAAIFMSFSTVIVAINALFLRKAKL
jgi:Cu2+-exporting ATPase